MNRLLTAVRLPLWSQVIGAHKVFYTAHGAKLESFWLCVLNECSCFTSGWSAPKLEDDGIAKESTTQ